MSVVVLLSVHIDVIGSGCPNSAYVVLGDKRSIVFMSNVNIPTLAADAQITCFMTFEIIYMGLLLICVFSSLL